MKPFSTYPKVREPPISSSMSEFINKVSLYDELYKTASSKSFIEFIAKAEEVLPLMTPPPPPPSYKSAVALITNTTHFPSEASSVGSDESDYFTEERKSASSDGDLTTVFALSGVKSSTLQFQMMRDYYRIHPEQFFVGSGHTSQGESEPHLTITVDYDIRDSKGGKPLKTHHYKFHAYYKAARNPQGKYSPRVFTHLTGFNQPDNCFISVAVFHAIDWPSA